jgi:predicted transcriptional regulator
MAVRTALDALEVELVATLRTLGFTWVELAEILDMTPQGVGKRYRATARDRRDRDRRSEPFVPLAPPR